MSHSYSASLIYGALAKQGSEAEGELKRRLEESMRTSRQWLGFNASWFAIGEVWIFAITDGSGDGPKRYGLRAGAPRGFIETRHDGAHQRISRDELRYPCEPMLTQALRRSGLSLFEFEEAGFLLAVEVWR